MIQDYQRNDEKKVIYVPFKVNSKQIILTYALIILNIMAYVCTLVIGKLNGWSNAEALWMFGAKVNYCIDAGEYWRLFTCMFLHASFAHLITNCYALFIYGRIVEKFFGRWRFIAIYFIAGLVSSCLSYLLSSGASVGASGAIFGLFGSLLYFGQRQKDIFKQVFGWQFMAILGLNLVMSFIVPEIDLFGHIGGLIGGYVATVMVGFIGEKRNVLLTVAMAATLVVIIGCCLIIKIV